LFPRVIVSSDLEGSLSEEVQKEVPEVKCWEILECEYESCSAFGEPDRVCWLLEDAACANRPGVKPEDKFIEVCSDCDVFEKRLERATGSKDR